MKKYNEPEFKIVITKNQDIITTSGEGQLLPSGILGWEAGSDSGVPMISL